MISDPVNVRAEPKASHTYRIIRGTSAAEAGVLGTDLLGRAVGHNREGGAPEAFLREHSLRLSQTLPCNGEGSVVR